MINVKQHTDIWLVRHPQTDWNQERRYMSRSDRPLTSLGQARAEAIARRLRHVRLELIVSTGQSRTDQLAGAVAAQRRQLPQQLIDVAWREADHGAWEGLTYAQVLERYASQAGQRFADPWHSRVHQGECVADLWARLEAAWDTLLRQHMGGHMLIVTHATPIQLLLCALLKVPFEQYWQFRIDLGGLSNIDLYPSGAIIRQLNEVPPLQAAAGGGAIKDTARRSA